MSYRLAANILKNKPTQKFFKAHEIEKRLKYSKVVNFSETNPIKNQLSSDLEQKAKAYRVMDPLLSVDLCPPINRNMEKLDRDFFRKQISLVQALFHDPRKIAKFMRSHSKDVLSIRGVPNVVKYPEYATARGVLLTERLNSINDAPVVLSKDCFEYFKKNDIFLSEYQLTLDYKFWRADEILKAILPEDLIDDVPSGFTQIGHIAHLNLRDEFKPYKHLIGEVILDKNENVKTVVDKISTIKTEFRTFPMEVLAGEPEFEVQHRESSCRFTFDFSKVYWNSRLQGEHERLLRKFLPGEVVVDVMAGVGPFSVPAGKNESIVLANDLNPESYRYLRRNILDNKVSTVKPYCLDGHDFIRHSLEYLKEYKEEHNGVIVDIYAKNRRSKKLKKEVIVEEKREIHIPDFPHHYVMNLPDSALSFLGDYNGIFTPFQYLTEIEDFKLPWIHVYCFEKFDPTTEEETPSDEELHKRVFAKIKNNLGSSTIKLEDVKFHLVRKVSPSKPMFCCSFVLPEDVAFRELDE